MAFKDKVSKIIEGNCNFCRLERISCLGSACNIRGFLEFIFDCVVFDNVVFDGVVFDGVVFNDLMFDDAIIVDFDDLVIAVVVFVEIFYLELEEYPVVARDLFMSMSTNHLSTITSL